MGIKASGRQYPLVARVPFTYEDLTSGVAEEALDLPPNAEVISGEVVVTTAWNSDGGTTPADSLIVGDGDDTNRYSASVIDLRTTGRTALDLTGYVYTGMDTVDLQWDPNSDTTTAPTQGEAFLVVEYIITGRANENQPS